MATFPLAKVIKLMNLSTSDNDHEALLALRNAQRIVTLHNKSWEDLLKKSEQNQFVSPPPPQGNSSSIPMDKPPRPRARNKQSTYDLQSYLFEFISRKNMDTEQQDFVKSLHSFWCRRGELTPKQQDVLERICKSKGWRFR